MSGDNRPGLDSVNHLIAKYHEHAEELRQLGEDTYGAGVEPDEEQLAEFARIGVLMEGAARAVRIVAKVHGIDLNIKVRGSAKVPRTNDLNQYLNRGH